MTLIFPDVDVRVLDRVLSLVATVQEYRPDVIIMDVNLPDGNGINAYRRLSASMPRLPVVFSSGDATESQLGDLMGQPHVAHLHKPYDETTLINALSTSVPPIGHAC